MKSDLLQYEKSTLNIKTLCTEENIYIVTISSILNILYSFITILLLPYLT